MVELPRKLQTEVNKYGRNMRRNIVDTVPFMWKYQDPSRVYIAERFGWKPESTGEQLNYRIRRDASKILGKPIREVEDSDLFKKVFSELEDQYWGALKGIPHSLLFMTYHHFKGKFDLQFIYDYDEPVFQLTRDEQGTFKLRTHKEEKPLTSEQLELMKTSFFRMKRAILKHPKTEQTTIALGIMKDAEKYIRGINQKQE